MNQLEPLIQLLLSWTALIHLALIKWLLRRGQARARWILVLIDLTMALYLSSTLFSHTNLFDAILIGFFASPLLMIGLFTLYYFLFVAKVAKDLPNTTKRKTRTVKTSRTRR